jgi:hypothetical protein
VIPAASRHDAESLVALAVMLADEAGLEAVSVRVLAARAGLPVHLLYRQVRNRAGLHAAMAERVIAERTPGPRPGRVILGRKCAGSPTRSGPCTAGIPGY